eukprot:Rmarinus@m.11482
MFGLSQRRCLAILSRRRSHEEKAVSDVKKIQRESQKVKKPIRTRAPITTADETVLIPQYEHPPQENLSRQKGLSVALVGLPNAGKSTLFNRLLGEKRSMVSDKAQATRLRTLGILTEGDVQVELFDTPGIAPRRHQSKIQQGLASHAWGGVAAADVVFVVVDALKRPGPEFRRFCERITDQWGEKYATSRADTEDTSYPKASRTELRAIQNSSKLSTPTMDGAPPEQHSSRLIDPNQQFELGGWVNSREEKRILRRQKRLQKRGSTKQTTGAMDPLPVSAAMYKDMIVPKLQLGDLVVILSKTDRVEKDKYVRYRMDELQSYLSFNHILELSPLCADEIHVQELRESLYNIAYHRPWSFGPRMKVHQSKMEEVKEVIREKLFDVLHQEVPYTVSQQNVGWSVLDDGTLQINQDIYVDRLSHLRMVVGSGGTSARYVYRNAEKELSARWGRPVRIILNVRVRKFDRQGMDPTI